MNTFLIADDHPLFREAMMDVVASTFPGSQLLQTENLAKTLEVTQQREDLDLLLLDLKMPGMQGFEGIKQIHAQRPTLPVVIISAEDDRQVVLGAMNAGAIGFISKASPREEMARALQQLLTGQVYLPSHSIRQTDLEITSKEPQPLAWQQLTKKQLEVLERMALGESNKQIAWHLNIAETTVKGHVAAIMSKLGIKNRVHLALTAQKHFSTQ
ncbi:two component transcriptional regulator, LuxR family [Marinospirillum celere]|uniref:Two component transcriptional regulator, LuxR family n=1 Tax=Marinospirillum celere TaxID=1122252 RepID=A0A1I1GND4_9GAMM|nr:response regulator transcription factor [Marinospirillum celere]SFC13279.1 two component transcriptional regulator, LuxR family [Marinospirillum celere]